MSGHLQGVRNGSWPWSWGQGAGQAGRGPVCSAQVVCGVQTSRLGVGEPSVAGDAERGGFIFTLESVGALTCVSAEKKVLRSRPACWGGGRRLA